MPSNLASLLIAPPWWLSLPAAALFALLAWAMRWLTPSGAASTFVVGAVVFGMGGGKFAVPLLTFFLTSSLLSKIGKSRKEGDSALEAKGASAPCYENRASRRSPVQAPLTYRERSDSRRLSLTLEHFSR